MGEGGAAALIEGAALHSGLRCRVRLHPGEGEVRFLVGGVSIPARIAYVTDTNRCTTLGKDGARLALVEHLLAALHIRGWWRGLTIEASAPELPILDGSAQGWLEAVTALGAPPPPPPALSVKEEHRWRFGASSVTVGPGERRLCSEIY
ncbi:MAG: UDP-3-O-acyl-N-acetylglucosamine deacetylase, partial [Deinococcota bacterium]|nr:UDP-3-O-acyl-N-acetylglucosamine deacetylase [Deinococcota bacterium]